MEFIDLLDDYLAQKKNIDELREQYIAHPYRYNASFGDYYYDEVERYQEARTRLNEFMRPRKSLVEMQFGKPFVGNGF